MFQKLVVLFSAVLFLSSCSKNNAEQEGEILYNYTGELISLVDQRNESVNKEFGVKFTLSMDKFKPTEHVFDKYNATFPKDYEGFGHVEFTERTKVYIHKGNTKTLISPLQLNPFLKPMPRNPDTTYQKLEVWITPYKKWDSAIEAIEVVVKMPDS